MKKILNTENKSGWFCSKNIIVLFGLSFIILFGLFWGMTNWIPRYPDPYGYLTNAAYLLDDKFNWGQVTYEMQRIYAAGYSVFLVPLLYLFDDIKIVLNGIWIQNLMAVCIMYILLYKITGIVCKDMKSINRMILCLIICISPACFFNIYTVTPETFSMLFLTIIAYILFKMEKEQKYPFVFVFLGMMLSCWTVLIHSRFLIIYIAYLIALFVLVIKKKVRILHGLVTALFGLGGYKIWNIVNHFLKTSVYCIEGVGGNTMDSQIVKIDYLFSIEGMASFVSNLFTQFFYLVVSSYGLLFIAIVVLVKELIRFFKKEDVNAGTVFVLAGLFGLLCLSSYFHIYPKRVDHLVYGRYIEAIIPVAIILACSEFRKLLKQKKSLDLLCFSCVVFLVTAAQLIIYRINHLNLVSFNIRPVLGFSLFQNAIAKDKNTFIVIGVLFSVIIGLVFLSYKKYSFSVNKISRFWVMGIIVLQICATGSSISAEKTENDRLRLPYLELDALLDYDDLEVYVIEGGSNSYLIQLMAYDKEVKVITEEQIQDCITSNRAYFIYDESDVYDQLTESDKLKIDGIKGCALVGGADYISYLRNSDLGVSDNLYINKEKELSADNVLINKDVISLGQYLKRDSAGQIATGMVKSTMNGMCNVSVSFVADNLSEGGYVEFYLDGEKVGEEKIVGDSHGNVKISKTIETMNNNVIFIKLFTNADCMIKDLSFQYYYGDVYNVLGKGQEKEFEIIKDCLDKLNLDDTVYVASVKNKIDLRSKTSYAKDILDVNEIKILKYGELETFIHQAEQKHGVILSGYMDERIIFDFVEKYDIVCVTDNYTLLVPANDKMRTLEKEKGISLSNKDTLIDMDYFRYDSDFGAVPEFSLDLSAGYYEITMNGDSLEPAATTTYTINRIGDYMESDEFVVSNAEEKKAHYFTNGLTSYTFSIQNSNIDCTAKIFISKNNQFDENTRISFSNLEDNTYYGKGLYPLGENGAWTNSKLCKFTLPVNTESGIVLSISMKSVKKQNLDICVGSDVIDTIELTDTLTKYEVKVPSQYIENGYLTFALRGTMLFDLPDEVVIENPTNYNRVGFMLKEMQLK